LSHSIRVTGSRGRRPASPLLIAGLLGCVGFAIATALYVVGTEFWSGREVETVDARGESPTVVLEPSMNPLRVVLHREGPRLRRGHRASVTVVLRDAGGEEQWSRSARWSGRSARGKKSGRGNVTSVLHTFEVRSAGEYRFEARVEAPAGDEPRSLRLEVRREVARTNPLLVVIGAVAAAACLLAGALGSRLAGA
jgi:hypothetical protein